MKRLFLKHRLKILMGFVWVFVLFGTKSIDRTSNGDYLLSIGLLLTCVLGLDFLQRYFTWKSVKKELDTIYVRLLDEGIDVWKPVKVSKSFNSDSFLILLPPENEVTPIEKLEFPLGSRVLVKTILLENKETVVAYALTGN